MAWVEKRVGRDGRTPSYRVRWRDPQGRLQSKTVTQAEGGRARADALARQIQVSIDRDDYLDPEGPRTRLEDWAGEWLAARRVAPSTANKTSWLWESHVRPEFGRRPMGQIRRMDIESWLADLERGHLSDETVHAAFHVLSGMLQAAVDNGLLARHPGRGIRLRAPQSREPRALDVKEAADLLNVLVGSSSIVVLTLLGTGLRFGELAGLQRQDLDLLRRQLQVRRAVREVAGRLEYAAPKTTGALRTVPLPAAVVEALAAHLPANGDPTDPVFCGPKGGLMSRTRFGARVFRPVLERAGLVGLHVHDLRHTYASWLEDAGIPRVAIEELLGHSQAHGRGRGAITARYLHVLPGVEDRVRAALDERLPELGSLGRTGEQPVT